MRSSYLLSSDDARAFASGRTYGDACLRERREQRLPVGVIADNLPERVGFCPVATGRSITRAELQLTAGEDTVSSFASVSRGCWVLAPISLACISVDASAPPLGPATVAR